ncbi:uncharacterized protein LOC108023198 [Drosophila biarmipes]|uniref:uncharacterized protein LOC108023198 n=1 Tax=Drosophila biarmipes TaxID=125945 RepID=UPI0007E61599|nr:uncharacterized protein LOC108023198 [Drosophila biarmipes]
MLRAFLRPSMKRMSRRPVSDEQKAQAQAQMRTRNRSQNQNQHQNHVEELESVEVFMSVATVSNLTQAQVQSRPTVQPEPQPLPLPQPQSMPEPLEQPEQQEELEPEVREEQQDKESQSQSQSEPEAEVLESGAQGDNEQSDNEVGPASAPASSTSEGQADAGDPAQMKALAGRQQIVRLLTRLGDGAGAEGDGEANQIVMELLGGSDGPTSLPSPSAIERVSEQLLRVLRERTLTEAGISTGNERYRCFKCVLQNYAKIYAARHFMEQLPQLEQLGPDVDANEERELFARVVAEEVLQIPVLLRQLWSSLEKMEFFNEDTAFKAYLEARRHPQARILCELMLTRISRVFLCIVSSTFFLDFTEHELTHILRNCYLSVNSEIEIFLSVVLWLEHNWFERGECAERILTEVRFALMPTWYLCTLDRANRCRHFSRVIQNPGVQRMIAQGLEDAVTLQTKPRLSGAAGGPTTTAGVHPMLQQSQNLEENHLARDWIADTECRHHHKRHCERFVYPTYDVFKEYLARIICCAPNYWRTFRPAQEVYRSDFRCCSPPHFN